MRRQPGRPDADRVLVQFGRRVQQLVGRVEFELVVEFLELVILVELVFEQLELLVIFAVVELVVFTIELVEQLVEVQQLLEFVAVEQLVELVAVEQQQLVLEGPTVGGRRQSSTRPFSLRMRWSGW